VVLVLSKADIATGTSVMRTIWAMMMIWAMMTSTLCPTHNYQLRKRGKSKARGTTVVGCMPTKQYMHIRSTG